MQRSHTAKSKEKGRIYSMETILMKIHLTKRFVLALFLTMGSFFTLPAYAWPDVDHMNMCGAAAKSVQTYGGNFKGWNAHDIYLFQRGSDYYFRTMCPETVAVKMKKAAYKKSVKKAPKLIITSVVEKQVLKRISRSHYNEKLDCARVDRMNGLGMVVKRIR